MADLADQAAAQNDIATEANLRQYRKPEGPRANGKCLYCKTPLPHGLRWCDSACRDDWEAEQR